MKDYFALLGQARMPWLDPEEVRKAFVTAAADTHPDRIHQASNAVRQESHQRYTELNEAQNCLIETRSRLKHLLELEQGRKVQDLQEVPETLLEIFSRLMPQLKAADLFLKELASATSPLLKVALLERGENHRESLQLVQATLRQRIADLENSVRELNAEWVSNSEPDSQVRTALLSKLETLYRLISFHDHWLRQVQSRILQWIT
jgi:hypothetical protein